MNELITIEQPKALAVFTTPDGLKPILDEIANTARALVPDVTTAKGRKEIASVAYKIAQSKTYIDGVGKDLVAEMKELPKKVDASRKEAREFLDALKDEIRAPLDAWETEQARIEEEKQAAERAEALAKQIALDHEMALLMNDAHDRKKEDEARRAEQDRIEAEKLAAEQAKAREEQIRQQAEQKAKEDAERQILEAKKQAARAEMEKIEAEQRAERAVEQERQRVAAEEAARRAEEELRQSDVEHKRTINRAVLAGLREHGGISQEEALNIVKAIATGKIKHVTITY